jgi:hypothetical protein
VVSPAGVGIRSSKKGLMVLIFLMALAAGHVVDLVGPTAEARSYLWELVDDLQYICTELEEAGDSLVVGGQNCNLVVLPEGVDDSLVVGEQNCNLVVLPEGVDDSLVVGGAEL